MPASPSRQSLSFRPRAILSRRALLPHPLAFHILLCLALLGVATPAHAFLQDGDTLPAITLAGPENPEDATVLGVPQGAPFELSDISTPYLLLQLFSMYCPHCQREAPHIKAMYEDMLKGGHTDELTLLGVGLGNSSYEVNYFRGKYQIPFPLVPDKDYALYDVAGRVGTPYYILCKKEGDHWTVQFVQEGVFEDKDAMLSMLGEKTGLSLQPQ